MMKNESENMSFTFKQNKPTILSPLLEIYRGKVYIKILKSFINDSIKCFGKEIFSIKKSCIRNLTNIYFVKLQTFFNEINQSSFFN